MSDINYIKPKNWISNYIMQQIIDDLFQKLMRYIVVKYGMACNAY
jgi:hypothetical protein